MKGFAFGSMSLALRILLAVSISMCFGLWVGCGVSLEARGCGFHECDWKFQRDGSFVGNICGEITNAKGGSA